MGVARQQTTAVTPLPWLRQLCQRRDYHLCTNTARWGYTVVPGPNRNLQLALRCTGVARGQSPHTRTITTGARSA